MKITAADKRLKIMQAMLAQVPFDGWTRRAFECGVKQAGIGQGEADLLFPQGVRDVIELFGTQADAAMQGHIRAMSGFARMRVRDKIAAAVSARLEFWTPYRDAVRRMMVWYLLPAYAPLGVKRLHKTVDLIWRAAGDSATDFNFYSKRLLLAGVIKATLLFWLNDESENCRDSWAFLDRRLDEVLTLGKSIGLAKEWLPLARIFRSRFT